MDTNHQPTIIDQLSPRKKNKKNSGKTLMLQATIQKND